eukprot:GHVU01191858.1.p1 GENE.GHVU01191858.1~~GHVU01191858.1.p1  ORF type:complete len:121 (-),score=10.56 GHVU01191858.1:763-1125(-)
MAPIAAVALHKRRRREHRDVGLADWYWCGGTGSGSPIPLAALRRWVLLLCCSAASAAAAAAGASSRWCRGHRCSTMEAWVHERVYAMHIMQTLAWEESRSRGGHARRVAACPPVSVCMTG